MPEFSYTARRFDGQDVSGLIAAPSRRDAMNALAKESLFPLTVQDPTDTNVVAAMLRMATRRKVRAEQIAGCLTQLSDLLHNGVPLLSALSLLAEQSPHPVLQEVMADVRDQRKK